MNETNVSGPHSSLVVMNAGDHIAQFSKKPKRFPGVSSFEDNDLASELFYGREEESQKLLHYILAESLFLIYSYSGYGKTSLLKARVFRKLREKNICPILVRFNKKDLSPQQLIQSETEAFGSEKGLEILHLNSDGQHTANPLIRYFKSLEIWSADDKLLTPAIVLDQFEEIFTLAHNQSYVASFFEDLAGLLKECKEGALNLKVIISIREDFLGHLEIMAVNIPSVFANRFRLEALRKEQANEAIIAPAQKVITGIEFASQPFSFSEKSAQEILDFLSLKMIEGVWKPSAYIEPVQLQIICSELENKIIQKEIGPGVDGQITIQPAHYGGVEGLQNIAANFYDQQIAAMQRHLKLTRKETDAVKEVIETGLIAGTRRVPMAYDAVISRPEVKREAVDLLIENKLLKLESHRSNSLLELSHDTLVAPVLKSGEQRVRDKEKGKRKKTTLRILFGVLALLVIVLILYIIYKNKSAKQANQDRYYYTAMMASQQNPTLAYKIAFEGKSIYSNTPKLDTLIGQLQRSKNGFIINRFQFGDPVVAAFFSPDKKEFTILGTSKAEDWVNGHRNISSVKADFLATCLINNVHHRIRWGADSILLVNKQDSILTFITSDDAKATPNDDEVMFIIKIFEVLMNRATGGAQRTVFINFIYDHNTLIYSKDSTLLFHQNALYLHDRKKDSFYVFNVGNTSFTPYVPKAKQLTFYNEESGYTSTGDINKLKALGVSSDLRYFIYSINDSLHILDVSSTSRVGIKKISKSISTTNYISISPNDSLIVTTGNSNIARLWNFKCELVANLQGHKANITYANFSSNGKEIITADEHGQVLVWKLAKDVTPKELVSFSPFNYREVGLNEPQYSIEGLYDTSSFAGLMAAAQDYKSSLPISNSELGDMNYFANLATAIDDIQQMYASIIKSDSFRLVSENETYTLVNSYTALLFQSFDYAQYKPGLAPNTTKRLENLANQLVKYRLQQKIDEENPYYSPEYAILEQIISFYRERKEYKESNRYLRKENELLKSLQRKLTTEPQRMDETISTNYLTLSYYLLFERDFKGAVNASDSALKYNPNDITPITNKALGYLLGGEFEKAKAIYLQYKDQLHDGFMTDFTDLENEKVLSGEDPNVVKIKALLKKPQSKVSVKNR